MSQAPATLPDDEGFYFYSGYSSDDLESSDELQLLPFYF